MNGFLRWMTMGVGLTILNLPGGSAYAGQAEATEPTRLLQILDRLGHTASGKSLLSRAKEAFGLRDPSMILEHLRLGGASRTDAVLTRHFNPLTGEEIREREVTIYLRESLKNDELVLDLAHELTHASSRPQWDPYDPQLTAGRYIQAAIEGEGGEVEAVVAECQVGLELADDSEPVRERCAAYFSAAAPAKIDRDRVRRDFYRVGRWASELVGRLGGEFALLPLLTADAPKLFSSTGHAPYPVALLREFEEITKVACENSRKRVSLVSSRSIASANRTERAKSGLDRFLSLRCNQP